MYNQAMKNRMNTKNQHDTEFWEEHSNESVQDVDLSDKHYHKLTYRVEKYYNEKKKKWMSHKITNCYSSGDTGSLIRDAMTGYYYNVKVGSKEEDAFFKVRVCHQKFNVNFPVTLFYSSPEEYEREHYQTLNFDTKIKWQRKYNDFCNKYKH
jgi:hypothetical protein